jgi:hypothetical protein
MLTIHYTGHTRNLAVAAVLALGLLLYLGVNIRWLPQRSPLVVYRQDHNSGISYHVDNTWGQSWQTDTLKEREDMLFDGVKRFTRVRRHHRSSLLFLVLTEDESSWGTDGRSPPRTFEDFLAMLNNAGVDLSNAAFGIMTSSEDEYQHIRDATLSTPFTRVTILLKGKEDEDNNLFTSRPRGGRHSKEFQTIRRANVALLRNELQARALEDERHVVWIDSDIKYLSPNIVKAMIDQSETKPDASIITALANTSYWSDYDKNAFQGSRSPPASHRVADAKVAEVEASASRKNVGQLLQESDADLIALDAVGATILYIRASLVHQGLTFPPYYVLGTGWDRDGWDGLETIGLCYVARYLRGGRCWTLGRGYYVEHTND